MIETIQLSTYIPKESVGSN